MGHLNPIRNTTRVAAAGSAIGYFACIAAGADPDVLLKEESKGRPLVQVMNSKGHHSIEEYEQSVEDCVISLAKSWMEEEEEGDDGRGGGQLNSSKILKL